MVVSLEQAIAAPFASRQLAAPGACDRMGLGFDTLHRIYPSLIVCDISGYGKDDPYETRKAYDLPRCSKRCKAGMGY